MSGAAPVRPVTLTRQAHPGLDTATRARVATSLASVAQRYGMEVDELVAETVRAENSSLAGNELAT